MKALIPVAGVGTQLRPHTHTQPKPLIPVAGKPILGHIIENLLSAGIKEQVFIVGYLREKIQEYVQEVYGDNITAEFVVQEPRKGLAHAIWTARAQIEGEVNILIVLGDTIFGDDTALVTKMEGNVLAVHQVDNPRAFGIAKLDDQRRVKALVEKPEIPRSNLALVGMYRISDVPLMIKVLDEMIAQPPRNGQEYVFTEALMDMVNAGGEMRTHRVESWFDCGRKQSLLQANRTLLLREAERTGNRPPDHPGTVIIPPVFIPEGCTIEQSIIGPFVALAENAVIRNSIVNNSIVGAYSELDSIILTQSVIGNDTSLRGKSNSINIGDNAEIDFDQ
ncbi:MAG: sugar phosphate nucleotidyltransferase [Bacteroidota bacterium]